MNWVKNAITSLILVFVFGISTQFLIFNCFVFRAAIEVLPVSSLVMAITESEDNRFKKVLAFVLSAIMLIGSGVAVAAYIFYPPLVLTCTIIVVALIVPHYKTIDTMDRRILWTLKAGIIALISTLILTPVTAFCFTLGWAVTILPTTLLMYAQWISRGAICYHFIMNNISFRFVSKILIAIAIILLILMVIFIFLLVSTFLTVTTAISLTIITYEIVDMECCEADRMQKSPFPIIMVADGLAAIGAAAVVGAARATAAEPHLWECAAALAIILALSSLIVSIGELRETDPHLDQNDPITSRAVLNVLAVAIVMMIMGMTVAGSYIYRHILPSTVSPMPFIACILLFICLFFLDNIRNNIARKLYIPFAVLFGCFAVAFAGTGMYIYFTICTAAILEALATGFCISATFTYYFIRTKQQKDKCEELHLAAVQLQQQRIQQHFWGPIAPAA